MVYSSCKINSKWILLLPLIFLFLPAFCIPLPSKPLVVYYILLCLTIIFYTIFNYNLVLKRIKIIYKYTPFKYFVFFIIWIFLSGLLNLCSGFYSIKTFIYYIINLVFIDYFLTYILPVLLFSPKTFNIKFFIKFLIVTYNTIFIIALLEFVGKITGLSIFCILTNFLSNQRSFIFDQFASIAYIDRVTSVFAEPGWFASFIFLNMPIIYSICGSKYTIFKNQLNNFFVKKFTIVLMLLSLIVAQSSIWLVFCTIITLFFYKRKIFKFIKKNILYAIPIFMLIVYGIISIYQNRYEIVSSNNYYSRIIRFILNVTNINCIILSDPSLGSRINSYIATTQIGFAHFWKGIGLGNTQYMIFPYFMNLHTPLTTENFNALKSFIASDKMFYNGAIVYQYFAEIGFLGILLYYTFLRKLLIYLNKIKDYFSFSIELDFLNGLRISILSIFFIIFYDINEAYYYIWFLFGLVNVFIFEALIRKRYMCKKYYNSEVTK